MPLDSTAYRVLHDFTADGETSFAAFMSWHAVPGCDMPKLRKECLGVLELRINADMPAAWTLPKELARDDQPHAIVFKEGQLIVEIQDLPTGGDEAA